MDILLPQAYSSQVLDGFTLSQYYASEFHYSLQIQTTMDDDIPELEDLQTQIKIATKDIKQSATHTDSTDYTTPIMRHVEDEKKRQQMLKQVEKEVKKVQQKVQKKEEGFGGFKKGFFASSETKKTQPKVHQIKKPKNPQNPLQFKEVQEAMKVNDYLTQTKDQWMTSDFLNNVSSNQKINKLFTNPQYMQAIDMFQKRPKQAMQKYGKNKEFMDCFQQFCKLMGSQFTQLAKTEKAAKK